MKDLELAPEYKDIADKILDKYPVGFGHVILDEILFLKDKSSSPKKYADIRNIRPPYSFITNYKFIITFYEAKMITLNDAQQVMVVFHELLHIADDFQKLRTHDIQDFRELVSKYGVNWDIDPNLPNILDDDQDAGPVATAVASNDDEDEEPEVL